MLIFIIKKPRRESLPGLKDNRKCLKKKKEKN